MELTVDLGEVQLDEPGITVVLDEPNCKVWHVSLATAGAKVMGYTTHRPDQKSVFLAAGPRATHTNPLHVGVLTELVIKGDGLWPWSVMAEVDRGICRIVMYKGSA